MAIVITMRKKILFVINTMGRAGAERCLLTLLEHMDPDKYDISLLSIINRGELFDEVPEDIRVLNADPCNLSVQDKKAKRWLAGEILRKGILGGWFFQNFHFLRKYASYQTKHNGLDLKKIFWKLFADSAPVLEEHYDVAVAYIEGAATAYAMDHVNAAKKVAFMHIELTESGYSPDLERPYYEKADRIYCVSRDIHDRFGEIYPDLAQKAEVFYNVLDLDKIKDEAQQTEDILPAFRPKRPGETRLLTAARLYPVKAYDLAVPALALVRERGYDVTWYALGDGVEQENIQRLIEEHDLEDSFVLLGTVGNPYPYMAASDIYVQATRQEGCCTSISEAMVLGKPVIASNCAGNVEQLDRYGAGLLVDLTIEGIANGIIQVIEHPGQMGVDSVGRKELTGQSALERFTQYIDDAS